MPETGRRPAGLRPWDSSGESVPGQQISSLPSTGAALSCPTTCPGQGDVLLPFLEAGLSGFLEEGRRGPAQHQTHPGEGGENLAGERALGQQWENRFARIVGRPRDSKARSVFVTVSQSLTLPRPQCTRLFRPPSPSICSSHSSHAERWVITGSVSQMKKLRSQEEESHAQTRRADGKELTFH